MINSDGGTVRRKQIMLTIGNRNYEIADTTQGYASLVAARKRCAIRIAYGAVADGIAGHAMDHDGGFIRGSA